MSPARRSAVEAVPVSCDSGSSSRPAPNPAFCFSARKEESSIPVSCGTVSFFSGGSNAEMMRSSVLADSCFFCPSAFPSSSRSSKSPAPNPVCFGFVTCFFAAFGTLMAGPSAERERESFHISRLGTPFTLESVSRCRTFSFAFSELESFSPEENPVSVFVSVSTAVSVSSVKRPASDVCVTRTISGLRSGRGSDGNHSAGGSG